MNADLWHRAPVNSERTFCGLEIEQGVHLATRPQTATCADCIGAEKPVVIVRVAEWDSIHKVERKGWRVYKATEMVTRQRFRTRAEATEWCRDLGHEVVG